MLFWIFTACSLACLYPLAIYPLLVLLLARLRPRPWQDAPFDGSVAFVITVFNEAARIRAKLVNTLALNPPPEGLQIVVVSDGSTDDTEAVVREFSQDAVRWISCPRRGKEAAQIVATRAISADVLVFSDASTTLEPNSLLEILRPLGDPEVGAVSGCDQVRGNDPASGERLFLSYEMAVRNAESLVGSLAGLSGCFFAVRRYVARQLLTDVPSDLGAALACTGLGLRAVSQPTAVCHYAPTEGSLRLFERWRRTALRGIRGLWAYRGCLGWHRPLASWQVVSHKWLRFLSPVFALVAILTAMLGAVHQETWGIVTVVCVASAATLGLVSLSRGWPVLRPFRPAGFAVVTNVAILAAWLSLAQRQTRVTWTPTTR
jgi:cellulose synthase/poly-beta-1,6-N-acetylglucosamine synthase-like glycosyltransferase